MCECVRRLVIFFGSVESLYTQEMCGGFGEMIFPFRTLLFMGTFYVAGADQQQENVFVAN